MIASATGDLRKTRDGCGCYGNSMPMYSVRVNRVNLQPLGKHLLIIPGIQTGHLVYIAFVLMKYQCSYAHRSVSSEHTHLCNITVHSFSVFGPVSPQFCMY